MDSDHDPLPEFAYTTGWNSWTLRPKGGKVWLTEEEARRRFEEGDSYFHVIDPVALRAQHPSFILKIGPPPGGRLTSERYNPAGSVMVIADLRAEDGRYFVDQVTSWTYPDSVTRYDMDESTSITKVTFEPDGSGTFSLRDKLEPANDMRLGARDIPVEDNWVDRFEFGQWDVLRNLKALQPTSPLLPPR